MSRLSCGAGGSWGFLGVGDAEHRLAVLALHQLPADIVGDGEDLATAEIWADELTRHNGNSTPVIGNQPDRLECADIRVIDPWAWSRAW